MVDTVNRGRGSGIFDHALMFISTGNLTRGKSASTALKIRGTPARGLSVRMMIPQFDGTTWKVLPYVQVSADDSTYRAVSYYPGGALSNLDSSAYATEIQWEFDVPRGFPYVKLGFTHTGGTTGSSLGAVKAGIVPRGIGEWRRNVRWD